MALRSVFFALSALVSLTPGSPVQRSTGQTSTADSGLLIKTSSGLIQGFTNSTAPNVRQFLGVPFAQPPLGDLRFAPPQAKQAETNTISALQLPDSCMQQFSNSSTIYTTYETGFLISGGDSEDCLYLSIWAPSIESIQTQQRPLPVLLYIPGGGFTSGGQASLFKVPDQWIERTQAHIVVIMNYRVNVFGFPNAPGLSDQNVGLMDQRMSVEWVQANIANFGGDPSRIVLWGQSAGGTSASIYPYGYPSDPIVAGLIADSGSPPSAVGKDLAQTNFTFLAGLVGCRDGSETDVLRCVRQVPARTLENTLSWYISNGTTPKISFTPIPDEKLIFSNWTQRIEQGQIAKLPLITGSNTNEGAGFVPFTPSGPGTTALFNTTQNIIACPVAAEVQRRTTAADDLPTYRYQYAGNFSNVSPVSWFGAYHSSELPLLFGTHAEYRGNSTEFEWQVSYAMEALWLSFAEDSTRGPARVAVGAVPVNPGGEAYFTWPEFEEGVDSMLLFAEDEMVMQIVGAERIDGSCPGL